MGNPWLERLKEYKSIHNIHTTFREDHSGESGGGGKNGNTSENPLDEIDRNTKTNIVGSSSPSKYCHTHENPLDEIDRNTRKTKKKLTPEEEYEETLKLADKWSGYVVNDDRARECLEWPSRRRT